MRITIETIPHAEQRLSGVGDWIVDSAGNIAIRVSDLGDWRYDAAVAVHELVEALLCRNAGVTTAEVDAFDIEWMPNPKADEPGDDPAAPYTRQHCFATAVERMLVAAMGLAWSEYADAVEALP